MGLVKELTNSCTYREIVSHAGHCAERCFGVLPNPPVCPKAPHQTGILAGKMGIVCMSRLPVFVCLRYIANREAADLSLLSKLTAIERRAPICCFHEISSSLTHTGAIRAGDDIFRNIGESTGGEQTRDYPLPASGPPNYEIVSTSKYGMNEAHCVPSRKRGSEEEEAVVLQYMKQADETLLLII